MVDCEYGIGRGRRPRQGNPLKDGLAQLDEYLSRLGLDSGTLMIFDRRPNVLRKRPNPEISRSTTPEGRDVTLFHA